MFSLMNYLDVEKKNRNLVWCSYMMFLTTGLLLPYIGVALPAMRESYGFDYSFQGALLSSQQIGTVLAIVIAAVLPSYIGRKKTTVGFMALMVIGMLLFTLTGNHVVLLLSFLLCGLAVGTIGNMGNVIAGQYTGNNSAGLNGLHAAFAVNATLIPIIGTLAGPSRWKEVFWGISAFAILVTGLCARSTLSNRKEPKESEGGSIVPKSFIFWINTFILLFYLASEACLMMWLVTFMQDTGILSRERAALSSSIMWSMMLVGRLCTAWLSSRVDKDRLLMTFGIGMALFFTMLISTENTALVLISVLGVGLSMSGIYPTVLATMPRRIMASNMATGISMGIASIGGIVMPLLVGIISDRTGNIKNGFRAVMITTLIMTALMIVKVAIKAKKERSI